MLHVELNVVRITDHVYVYTILFPSCMWLHASIQYTPYRCTQENQALPPAHHFLEVHVKLDHT